MEDTGEDVDYEEPIVGMVVYSDVEAYNLYNKYAFRKGFSVRKGHIRKDPQGNIRQREFMCSKEGFTKDEDLSEPRKRNNLEVRVGCKAVVLFSVKDGIYTLSHFNSHHNHDLATAKERPFLRSGRKVSSSSGDVISSMVDVGIRPTTAYSYLANEMGGAENVGFTKKDLHNYLQKRNDELMEAGDGQSLLNHLKRKQAEDPNFFYSVEVDHLNRIRNFFWRDSRSKLDYECFGDVVCFDTTFRTNKYNLICAPIVGVNHHWKNVLFGCAFLLDETTESFEWLFESFLQSMGNKSPITIFTDEDKAMANAIQNKLPQTRHRLCTWHIAKNASTNLASLYGIPEFKKQFKKVFHNSYSADQFQALWDELIYKWNLEDNPWLKKLYSLREKWCPAFSLDTFSANILSSQRSESTNNVFKQFSTHKMELIKFVHHYEKKAEEMRFQELEDDYRCKNGVPRLQVRSGILKDAVDAYTPKMFYLFEKEFVGCMGVRIKEVYSHEEISRYEAREETHRTVHTVEYHSVGHMVTCSCMMFETQGLLCSHALKVFDHKNLTSLPDQYIKKRWTKQAKKRVSFSNEQGADTTMNEKSLRSSRLSELMHKGQNLYDIASLTESGTKAVNDVLEEAMKRLEKDMEDLNMQDILKSIDETNCPIVVNKEAVLDPPVVKAKGITGTRIHYNLEKKKKKARRTKGGQEKENYTALTRTRALSLDSTSIGSVPVPQYKSNPPPTTQMMTFNPFLPPYMQSYIPTRPPFVPSCNPQVPSFLPANNIPPSPFLPTCSSSSYPFNVLPTPYFNQDSNI